MCLKGRSMPNAAPCGCGYRAPHITRCLSGVLWPTVWLACRCGQHNATWTERYEWNFNVPLGGQSWEQARQEG